MKVQRYTPWTIALIFACLVHVNGLALVTSPDPFQGPLVSVGILRFQDDSGIGAPPEVGQQLAQELHQKLATTFKDLLPRLISGGPDLAATSNLTIEQVVALGKQNGVKFVIRGGLLALTSEKAGQEVKISAQLYAEIISIDTASIVSTFRAEGAATQVDGVEKLATIDLKSERFRGSAAGRALTDTIVQLAGLSHQGVIAPASTEGQATVESGKTEGASASGPTETANAAESDTELQQLIAQAEAILSNGANVSTGSIDAVNKSLEALKSTLASKARLMEKGQDTAQTDQELSTRKEALAMAVAQVTAEVSASTETAGGEVEQPSGEKKGLLSSIDEFAGQALSILQKIQEIRAALHGVDEASQYEGSGEISADASAPTEESLSEGTGVVLDENGNPIEGAEVTDEQTGAEATTDGNGVYSLKGLLNGKLAKLVVKKGQMKMSAQAQVWPGSPTILDFQFKPVSMNGKMSASFVLPSTVLLKTSNTQIAAKGSLRGVVQDPKGRPVSRALVSLKGLAVARTNSQGQYAFLNVPVGTHQLLVNENGLKTKSAQVQVAAKKSADARIQFGPADKLAQPPTNGSLILLRAGSVLRGTILDNDNHPIGGAKVSVIQSVSSASVFTGSNGSYELRNLKPGPYLIVVSKVGFDSASQKIPLAANGTERRDLQLQRQNSPLIARILSNERARRGQVQGTNTAGAGTNRKVDSIKGQISGRVTDAETGKPVGGATITVEGHEPFKTDRQGNYQLRNVAAGNYKVAVSDAGYSSQTKVITLRAANLLRQDFALKPEARLGIQINEKAGRADTRFPDRPQIPRAGVMGQVLENRTAKPIAGAAISISGQRGTTTDSAGKFLIANLAPGTYQIIVGKAGYSSDQRAVGLRAGETATVTFTLMSQPLPAIRVPRH